MADGVYKNRLLTLGAKNDKGQASEYYVKRGDYEGLCAWVEAGGQEAPREPGTEG